jgi:hypothetical protein
MELLQKFWISLYVSKWEFPRKLEFRNCFSNDVVIKSINFPFIQELVAMAFILDLFSS